VPFEGALRQAPAGVLRSDSLYVPKPKHDLVMVVRVLFQVMCHGLYQTIAGSTMRETIWEFWKKMLVTDIWKALHKAAKREDYTELQAIKEDLAIEL